MVPMFNDILWLSCRAVEALTFTSSFIYAWDWRHSKTINSGGVREWLALNVVRLFNRRRSTFLFQRQVYAYCHMPRLKVRHLRHCMPVHFRGKFCASIAESSAIRDLHEVTHPSPAVHPLVQLTAQFIN